MKLRSFDTLGIRRLIEHFVLATSIVFGRGLNAILSFTPEADKYDSYHTRRVCKKKKSKLTPLFHHDNLK
jgi:hypothetical protein